MNIDVKKTNNPAGALQVKVNYDAIQHAVAAGTHQPEHPTWPNGPDF